MEQLIQQIEGYKQEIEQLQVGNPRALEDYRIRFLGSKGIVKNLFGELKNVPAEQKKSFGQVLNEFRQFAESKYEEWKQTTDHGPQIRQETIDLSLPGDPLPIGSRHPVSLMKNRIISIFERLGFSVAEGPEIEDDWHNFTALN